MSRITIGFGSVDVIVGYDQGGFFAQVWDAGNEERELLSVGLGPTKITTVRALRHRMGHYREAVTEQVAEVLRSHAHLFDQDSEVYIIHLADGATVAG
jgi:hypothetical protein